MILSISECKHRKVQVKVLIVFSNMFMSSSSLPIRKKPLLVAPPVVPAPRRQKDSSASSTSSTSSSSSPSATPPPCDAPASASATSPASASSSSSDSSSSSAAGGGGGYPYFSLHVQRAVCAEFPKGANVSFIFFFSRDFFFISYHSTFIDVVVVVSWCLFVVHSTKVSILPGVVLHIVRSIGGAIYFESDF